MLVKDASRVVEDSTPTISELDFCLDAFRKQKVLTDDEAYVQNIRRLISMRPGTFQSDPAMGIGISRYRFEDIDMLAAGQLTNEIETQIRDYIPTVPLEAVNVSIMQIPSGLVLYIDVSITSSKIKKITYAYLQQNHSIVASQVNIEKKKLINTEGSD